MSFIRKKIDDATLSMRLTSASSSSNSSSSTGNAIELSDAPFRQHAAVQEPANHHHQHTNSNSGFAQLEDAEVVLSPTVVPHASDDRDDDAPSTTTTTNTTDTTQNQQRREFRSVLADGWKAYLLRAMSEFFLGSRLNILLLCIPGAIIARIGAWSDSAVLVLSLLALCPLAERISFVTDEYCLYTSDTIGGLLSATMGNMTELIVSMFALHKGLLRVVQVSLLGSILSNLLLVLGCAFLFGGLKHERQQYNKVAAQANTSLLQLAVIALLFPVTMNVTNDAPSGDPQELSLSRFSGFLLLGIYGMLIYYQLKSHRSLFESREEQDDDAVPVLGTWGSFVAGSAVTGIIAVLSSFVVNAIEGAAKQLHIPVLFIGTILLPIVGNAAEHASAVIFATRDRLDIALGIAAGSATQIALFVIPLNVIMGWMMGQPMSLDFEVFDSITLFLTVILVSSAINTGRSDWMKGILLCATYMLISGAYWVRPPPADMTNGTGNSSNSTKTQQ